MGYYPPYIPDTYLQVFRPIPSTRMGIKRVERIPFKKTELERWEGQMMLREEIKKQTGLGLYFDQYV